MAKRKASNTEIDVGDSVSRNDPGKLDYAALISAMTESHELSQQHVAQAVNVALTARNWVIGCYIVEYEQHGSDRAEHHLVIDQMTQGICVLSR